MVFESENNKNFANVQMKTAQNHNKYQKLRKEYPVFEYSESNIVKFAGGLELSFRFKVGPEIEFLPKIFIPLDPKQLPLNNDLLRTLCFSIGMVEMISYWKAFCSPKILINPFRLMPLQENWWKKLFRHGLGEFFYTNGIEVPGEEIFEFIYDENAAVHSKYGAKTSTERFVVPIGGGKDSIVTLALLQKYHLEFKALVLNQRGATREVIEVSSIREKDVIEVVRKIDPLLLELNHQGFLNGHTPFSALLAFVSAMVSAITGHGSVALSNESSANEPTIPGTNINHQYSKSLEFESDFRFYLNEFVATEINYFSLLRPLNELQIAALFSNLEKYHGVFKSCNVGSKSDTWCCRCSKCLFTYIILFPFLGEEKLVRIFGQNLFEKPELLIMIEDLSGISQNKPFECVGTIEEVNAALQKAIDYHGDNNLPSLLVHYQKRKNESLPQKGFDELLLEFQHPHFVGSGLVKVLREEMLRLKD